MDRRRESCITRPPHLILTARNVGLHLALQMNSDMRPGSRSEMGKIAPKLHAKNINKDKELLLGTGRGK